MIAEIAAVRNRLYKLYSMYNVSVTVNPASGWNMVAWNSLYNCRRFDNIWRQIFIYFRRWSDRQLRIEPSSMLNRFYYHSRIGMGRCISTLHWARYKCRHVEINADSHWSILGLNYLINFADPVFVLPRYLPHPILFSIYKLITGLISGDLANPPIYSPTDPYLGAATFGLNSWEINFQ